MPRADNIWADLERIQSMSDDKFADEWGDWARAQDKDLRLVRERWIRDLQHMLEYAAHEDEAVEELVAAKQAFADEPTDANRMRKARAVKAVQAIRAEERTTRTGVRVCGDAYVSGV